MRPAAVGGNVEQSRISNSLFPWEMRSRILRNKIKSQVAKKVGHIQDEALKARKGPENPAGQTPPSLHSVPWEEQGQMPEENHKAPKTAGSRSQSKEPGEIIKGDWKKMIRGMCSSIRCRESTRAESRGCGCVFVFGYAWYAPT